MQEVIHTSQVVARSKSTILITGETGTGKEMVARAIHYPQRPAGNAAHQGELRRDSGDAARVGAVRPRARRIHRRDHEQERKVRARRWRTIFLDEIGTMSPALQAKLLRVLQEREFEALGSERTQKVDVRVIAATQSRSPADGGRRPIPGGSLLPAERHPDPHPAAARAARGRTGTRRTLHRQTRATGRQAYRRSRAGRDRGPAGGRVAGERARARKHC